MQRKAFTFSWPAWRIGVPQWHLTDYDTYVAEGFNLNTLIYSAIMYKVRAMTAAPLRAWTGDVESPELLPADEPLQQLLQRPNPHQSFNEFQQQNIVYLNVDGNSYILMDRPAANAPPEAMYSLRPDRIFIVPAVVDGVATIGGFLYVKEGASAFGRLSVVDKIAKVMSGEVIMIPPQDMMHVKLPNPGDPLEGMGYGLSPISSLARSADVANAITHFLKLFFDNGVVLPGILSTDQPLTENVVGRIRERWKEYYGGYDKWAEQVGVLERGLTYQRIGLPFNEMGFDEQDQRNESRILGPLGVPPILVGSRLGLLRSTYANYKEARQAFWQDTMEPENNLFEVDYQFYLNQDDTFVRYDYSRVPAFQEIRQQKQDRFATGWETGGITRNEYRRSLGLSQTDDGDVYRTQLTTIFLPQLLEGGTTAQGSPTAEDETRKNIVPLHLKKKARLV